MALTWIRWYVEQLHDSKLDACSIAEVGIWDRLCLLAGSLAEKGNPDNGRIAVCEGVWHTWETLASAIKLKPAEYDLLKPAMEKFRRFRMIDYEEQGGELVGLCVVNFAKRNPPGEPRANINARVARHRAIKREGNGDVTALHKRYSDAGNAPRTEQKRREKKREEESTLPLSLPHGEESPKPSKVKYAEYVSMTPEQHRKLVDQFGELLTARMITILDNYKGANGKRYKDDYRAILNWVVKRVVEEDRARAPTGDRKTPRAFASLEAYVNGEVDT